MYDVQHVKQHHARTVNPTTGDRGPLTACRRQDNPKQFKLYVAPTMWWIDTPDVLCSGLLRQMGMALSDRCKLGGLHGPMKQDSIHESQPAISAAQQCNSDVQLPYRFPMIPETHSCGDENCLKQTDHVAVRCEQFCARRPRRGTYVTVARSDNP